MVDQGLVVALSVSVMFNVIAPLWLWFGWEGIRLKLNRWSVNRGRKEATAWITKNNNINLVFHKNKGVESGLNYKGGIYSRTPSSDLIYRLMGVNCKLRRENDPEEFDVWARPNATGMTAKEIDNVVNEQMGDGLVAMLKMYLPMVLVLVVVIVVLAVFAIYFQWANYENLKEIAPTITKFVPEALKP